MAVGTSRDDANIVGILNSGNYTSSKNKFLPGLADVENMNTWAGSGGCAGPSIDYALAPSTLLFQTYGSICLSQFLVPI
jgi:hypothetical protein